MARVSRRLTPVLCASLVAGMLGCSGGGKTPLAPAGPAAPESPAADLATGAPLSGFPLFLAEGTVDFDSGAISLTPLDPRSGQLTPVADDRRAIDVNPFLSGDPCADCFRVTGLGLDGAGNVIADFTMRHPFPSPVQRADLDVFDPIAIFVMPGTSTFDGLDPIDEDGDGGGDARPLGNVDLIANPDGFTIRHDDVIDALFPEKNLTGNINPFISFFTENDFSAEGVGAFIPYHRFGMTPNADTKRVTLRRPGGSQTTQYNFVVAISVSYGVSATFGNTVENPGALGARLNPVYFNPEFNMKEAYSVDVQVEGAIPSGGASESTDVAVFVRDWQATATVDGGYPNFPTYTNRTGLKYASNVAQVKLQVPGVSATTYVKTRAGATEGEGSELSPYRFDFTVTNDLLAPAGNYMGLIAVIDEYQLNGQVLLGFTAEERLAHFTTYQVVPVVVEDPGCPNPTAVAQADKTSAASDEDITFACDASSTPVGTTLVEYAWDFDGSAPPEVVQATPADVLWSFTNSTGADITATGTLTVRNSCGATHASDVDVTIRANQAPSADIDAAPNPVPSGGQVTLDATGSTDPDVGDLLTYEWDFDYDGVTFGPEPGQTGTTAQTSYTNAGVSPIQKTAAVRVTDNHTASDIASVVITINPAGPCNPPEAHVGSSTTTATSGLPVEFYANLSNKLPGDTWLKYTWDWNIFDADPPETFFPDGDFLPLVEHTYINVGPGNRSFQARLTVYTTETCSDATGPGAACTSDPTQCDLIITVLPNSPPIAVCGADPENGLAGIPVIFDETGSGDPDPFDDLLFQWDWDDRDGIDWVSPDYSSPDMGGASHAYDNATGTPIQFNATLRVLDEKGASTTCSVPLVVQPQHPPAAVADASPNPSGYSGATVNLIDIASSDPDTPIGDALTYVWDFDNADGVILDPANPSVDYVGTAPNGASNAYINPSGDPITVTATLRVIDLGNNFDDADVVITVDPPLPPPTITKAETQAANAAGNSFLYQKKLIKSLTSISGDMGPNKTWDFTDLSEYPNSPQTLPSTYGTPSDYPNVNIPNATIINFAQTGLGEPNYEGRAFPATFNDPSGDCSGTECVPIWGLSSGGGDDLRLTDPVTIEYPQTIDTLWLMFGEGLLDPWEVELNITVAHGSFGHAIVGAGTFWCLVEDATVTQTYIDPDLGPILTATQREYTWVADNGWIIAQWTQRLDALGQPTQDMGGKTLNTGP